MTPKERVVVAVESWGEDEVVACCAAILRTDPATVVADHMLDVAMVLGSVSQRDWLAGGKPPGHAYWARVWAARALRYVWSDRASGAVVHALRDDAWRVREMAAKVVADHELGEGADELVVRTTDDEPRVRAAAVRSLGIVGEGEHIDAVVALLDDLDDRVARAAHTALDTLGRRLDRPVDVAGRP